MATIGIMEGYISRKELAAELGVWFETLIRWEKDGKGPPVTRIGRRPVYSRVSLQKWLKTQERAAKGATNANAA
jgi:predicted site-specific integrase-resolvase